jgi:hypothetical protein
MMVADRAGKGVSVFSRECYYCWGYNPPQARRCAKCGARLTVLDAFALWRLFRHLRRRRARARRH